MAAADDKLQEKAENGIGNSGIDSANSDSLPPFESRHSQQQAGDTTMSSGISSPWKKLEDGADGNAHQPVRLNDSKKDVPGRMEPIHDVRRIATADEQSNNDGRADGVPEVEVIEGSRVTYKVYKRRWFGLLQLVLMNIIVSWDWLTYSPVSSDAATYFDTSENTINWLSTGFLFAFVVACPATIWVLHMGPRPAIITASVLLLAGNWIRYGGTRAADHGEFGVVMFGQILTGLAQPFVLSAPARYSDLWFTDRGRVTATAVASLANPFGAALGQLIVPFWVNKPVDVPNMVLYVTIISTVASVPSFFIPAKPPTPAAPSGETPKTALGESIRILVTSVEFWLLFIPFSIYVGFFNSVSSLLNQIFGPYGFSDNQAGIAGALLIVVGLVAAAITSPILDRTKAFILAVKIAVPIIALSLLVFIWMPQTQSLAGPYVVLSVLGAASFSLVPVAVELLVELNHPVSPEVTSTISWAGGQLLGGCFILISDALKAGVDGDPPSNMKRALIFTAVVGLVATIPPLCLGLFGRSENVKLRRFDSDIHPSRRD